ncbi:hypothetical protein ACFQMM_17515 [Saliphagus sp. GCM10025308]|uniref:Uncharacterized protein n=1 Tax=Natronosalvus rutilus TaxID=2953753 RepID=A0A9E7SW19_9EURY|nr:hypothetical protein [Natronosalvus rutilus]UTF53576.1 hypothetical protein NGM29_17700 [Natronosalvus rutilus]
MSGPRRRPRQTGDVSGGRRLKLGFLLLVALSGATMAFQGGASLPVVALATLIGGLAGGALLWYVSWITR